MHAYVASTQDYAVARFLSLSFSLRSSLARSRPHSSATSIVHFLVFAHYMCVRVCVVGRYVVTANNHKRKHAHAQPSRHTAALGYREKLQSI